MTEENTTTALGGEQAARAEAVKVAASLLRRRNGVAFDAASAWEVIALADYIVTGEQSDLDVTEEAAPLSEAAVPMNVYMSFGDHDPAYHVVMDHGAFVSGLQELGEAMRASENAVVHSDTNAVSKFLNVLGIRVNTTLEGGR